MMNRDEVLKLAEEAQLGKAADNGLWVDYRAAFANVFKFAELLLSAKQAQDPVAPKKEAFYIASGDLKAFNRFCECCEDSDAGGYDVPKEMMKRLAYIGLVRAVGFGRYETTEFGDHIRDKQTAPPSTAQISEAREKALEELFEHIEAYPSLNMANYSEDDVGELNVWGLELWKMARSLKHQEHAAPELSERDKYRIASGRVRSEAHLRALKEPAAQPALPAQESNGFGDHNLVQRLRTNSMGLERVAADRIEALERQIAALTQTASEQDREDAERYRQLLSMSSEEAAELFAMDDIDAMELQIDEAIAARKEAKP